MNYKITILNKLIDKYERSKLSKDGSSKNLKIFLNFDLKNMPDYCNEDSYKYIIEIENCVDFLESQNYITVIKLKGRIKKVILNIDKLYEVYNFLNRDAKTFINNMYLSIMNKYIATNEALCFRNYIINLLNNYKSTSKYFVNNEELEDIMIALNNLDKKCDKISLRNYSARYLKDSKKLEKLEVRFKNIIRDIFKMNDTFDEYLEGYNIYRNPSILHLRGNGIFKINDLIIDLSEIDNELIISSKQLKDLSIVNLNIDNVITIENLTTFNDFNCENNLLLYLAGYHNSSKKVLLKKIFDYNNSLNFIHLGDIDAGGFYILNNLIEDTGINFSTYKMDLETLKKYDQYTKKLTDNDIARLNKLKGIESLEEYYDTFEYMLENNVKLEQENIIYYE